VKDLVGSWLGTYSPYSEAYTKTVHGGALPSLFSLLVYIVSRGFRREYRFNQAPRLVASIKWEGESLFWHVFDWKQCTYQGSTIPRTCNLVVFKSVLMFL
jgi:hypothetical protein